MSRDYAQNLIRHLGNDYLSSCEDKNKMEFLRSFSDIMPTSRLAERAEYDWSCSEYCAFFPKSELFEKDIDFFTTGVEFTDEGSQIIERHLGLSYISFRYQGSGTFYDETTPGYYISFMI